MNVVAQRVISPNDPAFMAYRKTVRNREHLMQVQSVGAWKDKVEDLLDNPWKSRGSVLPWPTTRDKFRLRSGELSLWAGKNGHGKSAVLSNVLTWMAASDEKVMIASFEMPVEQTIERMMKQATGCENPSRKVRDEFWQKFEGRVYFYDYIGTIRPDLVLDLVDFSAEVLGCKHIQIDSLTKVKGMVSDKNDLQADFVNDLHSSAKHFGIHIHLVAHEKKGHEGSEGKPQGRYDIKGSGAIPDQVDNVLMVWQDKKKRQTKEVDESKPDTFIRVDKQRHGMWEGYIALWFAKVENWQFVDQERQPRAHCPGMSFV